MWGMLEDMIQQMLGLEDDLVAIAEFIKKVPFANITAESADLALIIDNVSSILLSTGYTLLVFFFFIDFFKKTIMFEFVNWETIVKVLLRFFVAKFILSEFHLVLEGIAIVVNGLIEGVGTVAKDGSIEALLDSGDIKQQFDALPGLIEELLFFVKLLIIWIIMMVIRLAILFIGYGRFVEICIYTAIAPIPLSTLVGEETSSIAKKFFQGYIAVLLQGLIIVVMCFIYLGLVSTFTGNTPQGLDGGLIQYLICSIVLLFTMLKSGSWAKQIMGM
ncbi:MAG: hypothetical protein ACOX2N_08480 [Peptococcia bacterium]|jgi:hypothetical protein